MHKLPSWWQFLGLGYCAIYGRAMCWTVRILATELL